MKNEALNYHIGIMEAAVKAVVKFKDVMSGEHKSQVRSIIEQLRRTLEDPYYSDPTRMYIGPGGTGLFDQKREKKRRDYQKHSKDLHDLHTKKRLDIPGREMVHTVLDRDNGTITYNANGKGKGKAVVITGGEINELDVH